MLKSQWCSDVANPSIMECVSSVIKNVQRQLMLLRLIVPDNESISFCFYLIFLYLILSYLIFQLDEDGYYGANLALHGDLHLPEDDWNTIIANRDYQARPRLVYDDVMSLLALCEGNLLINDGFHITNLCITGPFAPVSLAKGQ